MAAVTVDVDLSGPIFDRRADEAAAEAVREAQESVAKQGLAEVHKILDRSIRNPTPYYETQLLVERVAEDMVVHDRGIVYGPWLEGVGSRNRTTRFKGYFAFRRSTHRIRREAPRIAERVVRRHIQRMGG